MTETLTTILQWLIPSGGLGAVLVWITNRTLRNTRTAKEVHDTYKAMYEDMQKTLIELRNDNEKLYKVVTRLEHTITHAYACRYWDHCPIRAELPDTKGHVPEYRRKDSFSGQPRIRNPDYNDGGNTEIGTDAEDTDSRPP